VADGNRYRMESSAVVRPRGADRAARLADLHQSMSELVARLEPDAAAVESSFSGRNPKSSLALAESRGAILAAIGHAGIPVHPYTPAEVKSAVVGHGRAEKDQVIYMVVRLLGLDTPPPQDAADAAAVALTHLHLNRWKRLS
jgi:crossover junction endodeoxyribonuclease RuvC